MSSTLAAGPESAASGSPARRMMPLHLRILRPLASLQVTVALFAISLILVFFGTVAMMQSGLWTIVDEYFRSAIVWIPIDLIRKFGTVFFDLPKDGATWPGKVPYPGGWLIGSCMLVNLIAAHLIRFKLTWKRSGIVFLHAGVIALMLGELITGMWAVESMMTIRLGETTDFVDVTRETEIAVTDSSDSAVEHVATIPQWMFSRPGIVRDVNLPFDLEVIEYWKNTEDIWRDRNEEPITVRPSGEHVFPTKIGVWHRLERRNESAGVDTEAHGDAPSVIVRVLDKETGKEIAKYLLSICFYPNYEGNRRMFEFPRQTATVGGTEYALMLRNKREYKPYDVELLKFEHGKYPGTEIPKDFASTVKVTDKATGDQRKVRIWMNNPLRYQGDSLYQHAVLLGDSGTILQVVRNPGRLLPYISCSLIVLGMLIHFGFRLSGFLSKGKRVVVATIGLPMNVDRFGKLFPYLVLALCSAWMVSKFIPPKPAADSVDYFALGQLPVRDGGRVMPLDSLARSTLQAISGKTEVKDRDGNKIASATEWVVGVMDTLEVGAGPAADFPVFRIEHDQLLAALELPPRPGFYRYSVKEMEAALPALRAEGRRVNEKKKDGRPLDLYDAKVGELVGKVNRYFQLVDDSAPQVIPPQSASSDWFTLAQVDALHRPTEEEVRQVREEATERLVNRLKSKYPNIEDIPPEVQRQVRGLIESDVRSRLAGLAASHREDIPVAEAFTRILLAARGGKGGEVNRLLGEYRQQYLSFVPAEDLFKIWLEAWGLDNFSPFYDCGLLYLFAIILGIFSWLVWSEPLRRSAFLLCIFTVLVHTAALGVRMYVQGRPPVTNLYSSAIFIGWGAAILCLFLEAYYRNGIGVVVCGASGAATMMIAHFLSESGADTMGMLQAVLDTNFWLATHVTTVTLGYTATFVAGLISIIYLVRGLFTTSLNSTMEKTLGQMIYGVLCFATLLSFTGTVLGGIWADYSWGRFWGWDPKENGAVMIVIWNVLILHARWCGLVKNRGMAVLAIIGNMITAWSWFGTNQLGIGLHAYGFDKTLAERCRWFWISQSVLVVIGLTPLHYWRSFAANESR